MRELPATYNPLVVRTNFSDDLAWEGLRAAMARPWAEESEFDEIVTCVSDPDYAGMTVAQVVELAGRDEDMTVAFLADEVALTQPDNPVLVVDLWEEPGRTFRVIPSEVVAVSANLSLANMDFSEFADSVDEAGIYRG